MNRPPWFVMGRPAGAGVGSLDLVPLDGVDAADLVALIARECRLRAFSVVRVTVASRTGLGVLASLARRLNGVEFVVSLRGGLPDAGPASGLSNVAVGRP